jgi:hypothetical protein
MKFIIDSYLWTLIVFAQYFLISYLSFRISKQEIPFYYVWLVGIIPSWTILCRYANDIVITGFIFDFLAVFGWTAGVIIFKNKELGMYQYIGITLMLLGILIFKK